MTIRNLLEKAKSLLIKNNKESNLAKELFYYLKNWDDNFIVLNENLILSKSFIKKYLKILNIIICKNYPIQYFFKKSFFFGNPFYVNKNVLIPRYDTELLVDFVINEKVYGDILEIGTGSGAISITLKSILKDNISISATDISNKAIRVAKKNAKTYNTKITFIKSDLFNNIKGKYNVIIANLPYLKNNQIKGSLLYEPKLALYGGSCGLEIIYRFLDDVLLYLKDAKSYAIIEHDPMQKEAITEYLLKMTKNLAIFTIKDYNKLDRFSLIRNRRVK